MNELIAHINDLNIDDAPKRERAFKYEAFQRKIRLYNKMLRPMREMSQ